MTTTFLSLLRRTKCTKQYHETAVLKLCAGIDESGERIQAKIRVASTLKIPYLLVVGPTDQQQREVSVRARGIQRNLGALPLETFVQSVTGEVRTRGRDTLLAEHFEAAAV